MKKVKESFKMKEENVELMKQIVKPKSCWVLCKKRCKKRVKRLSCLSILNYHTGGVFYDEKFEYTTMTNILVSIALIIIILVFGVSKILTYGQI